MKKMYCLIRNILFVSVLTVILFTNRVFCTEHTIITQADPTVFYHEGVYYLYGSGGNNGIAVYTSTDLKNWNGPAGLRDGYALKNGDHTFGTAGFWAPQVFYYNNKFYMAYTAEENIAIAVSDSPLGPFTQDVKAPLFPLGTRNIDPFIFMDDDGKKYLYYVNTTSGGNRIYVIEMEDDLSATRGTREECLRATGGTWEKTAFSNFIVEGPTVVKQGGQYFLIYSANAWTDIDYAVGYATSSSPTGPWNKYCCNPVINRHNMGINGPGHGDLFKDAEGNWKYVFHTHNSNTVIYHRKTAIVDAGFVNGGQQFEIDIPSFNYLKRTVYFKQDFNSSTNYLDYVGAGGNQFTGLVFNGNSNINTLNNKLQIVKNGVTGNNRAGVTKTDDPFNPGGTGGFLKFEMEVAVSNNTVNVPNGFRFSVGIMSGTAPASPSAENVHSDLYINPTATPGTFVLQAGHGASIVSSQPLPGTQKLVWYINNSGDKAGYRAPDGTLSDVANDAADVWAIDGTGTATLVLNNVPATTPSIAGLRTFRISNDANFVATLDIDDIVISEEPVLEVLPVTLISFTGTNSGRHIQLNWETASEQNNSHFEVLRSADGITFKPIGNIKGNGTSNQYHSYSYADHFPLAGVNYYQLKQVDFDGNETIFPEIVSVKASIKLDEFKVFAVADNQIKVSVCLPGKATGDLLISDILGRKVYNRKVSLDKGCNVISVSDVDLPDGILIGSLMIAGNLYSVKFEK